MKHKKFSLAVVGLIGLIVFSSQAEADELFIKGDDGLIRVVPPQVPAKWRNSAWPAEMERAFHERTNHAMRYFQDRRTVNTHAEREKGDYPGVMFAYMAGHHGDAIAALETPDLQAGTDHAWTLGIDYYWNFTLKGQMRKYFQFGDKLTPEYRERMKKAAEIWVAEDPRPTLELVLSLESEDKVVRDYALELLNKIRANIAKIDDIQDVMAGQDLGADPEKWTAWWKQYADKGWQTFEDVERRANPFPHPRYGVGTGPVGAQWDPAVRGMRVDARNTDNLRAMREIAVYLMAEEVGNDKVRRLHKDKIRRFVADMYHVGMGEWDSENYLHHTIAPYHNLYDFAKDEEVVAMAKAALDWMYAAAAVKYYRGQAPAPTKRTGGGLNRYTWMIFGDTPVMAPSPEYDLAHVTMSAYRPPLAVMALAQKKFDPVEMINTKPTYSLWLPGAAETPETWETIFQGRTYYLGSAVARSGAGDVRAFEMLTYSAERGSDTFRANSGNNTNGKRAGDQIAQYRNLLVWLRPGGPQFTFNVPGYATAKQENGIWFIEFEKTYLALRPINLKSDAFEAINRSKSGSATIRAAHTEGAYAGFAMELGEQPDYANFDAFVNAVKSRSKLDLSKVNQGTVTLTGADGKTLAITHNRQNDLPTIERDGKVYNWLENFDLYKSIGGKGPIDLGWREGTLRVRAGGHTFEQTVTREGKVTFTAK